MKLKKSIVLTLVAASLALAGCSDYKSSYSATSHIEVFTDDSAEISFGSLQGTEAVKIGEDMKDFSLEYDAELGEGSITVYYDNDGTKKELFKLESGEKADSEIELEAGPVNIILETDGECKEGDFEFKIK